MTDKTSSISDLRNGLEHQAKVRAIKELKRRQIMMEARESGYNREAIATLYERLLDYAFQAGDLRTAESAIKALAKLSGIES